MDDSLTVAPAGQGAPQSSSFSPPAWLANAHVQSIVPSLKVFRGPMLAKRARKVIEQAEDHILDCGDGVRLLGHYTAQPQDNKSASARHMVVLMHGWEGDAESPYVLSLASCLYERGCDIFRLNFRDHGPTHHLNQDIFHSCRLPEMLGAIHRIQQTFPEHRLSVAGFSLGGNFAMRIAANAPAAGIRLERAAAVCPVLCPHSTMEVLENGWSLYQQYFVTKWKRSLRIKQTLFPHLLDFGEIFAQRSIRDMTRVMVKAYSEFTDLDEYLDGYSIVGNVLAALEVPVHVFIALDDPIIPAHDLKSLPRTPFLQINAAANGGHCGFMDRLGGESWADRQLAQILTRT